MTKRKALNQMDRSNWKGFRKEEKIEKKSGIRRIEMARDISVIFDLYLWKRLNDDDEQGLDFDDLKIL